MVEYNLHVPAACPFHVRRLNKSIYLFREHDNYGQFPNIYAKICSTSDANGTSSSPTSVIVLSDAGCATSIKNPEYDISKDPSTPKYWNIYTVLKHTINPHGQLPYLVITTHCHFDHILGLGLLPPTDSDPQNLHIDQRKGPQTTVLSSAHNANHINPWNRICCHSLAKKFNAKCPYYSIGMWATDYQDVIYLAPTTTPGSSIKIPTGITIIHTPGHTPDSLTWYDRDSHLICVGDSFYESSSKDTKECELEKSIRAPIIFEERSHLKTWWENLNKVLKFVKTENDRLASQHTGPTTAPCVAIAASHVTTTFPDAVGFLISIREFMARILRGEVPMTPLDSGVLPFEDFMVYDDGLEAGSSKDFEWIVWAPRQIIEEGIKELMGEY
ncbi:hypothetical protein N7478_009019 [Penicillium angulare]|uniref:uncharacterized protein n=1 Tax=Penicillium angulare TaxID=116970 RepID=UPI00253F9A10|nr:uncharacterized protein N7478_009019 [Penicillium angulare]KAJ5273894.1 hypothetical protein N7478_009019 [Penicillium angulare]